MTVPASILKKGPYLIDGKTGPFDYDWRIYDAAHLLVVVKNADDTEAELSYPADYSVEGVDDEDGGFITLTVAGTTDQELWITPNFPPEQIEDFSNQRAPFTTSVEDALDKQMVVVKQQGEILGRTVKVPISSDQNPDDVIDDLEQGVIDAQTSAANAAISETNAAQSAVDAAASEATTVGAAEDIQAIVDGFSGAYITDRFSGDDVETDFTLSFTPLSPTAVSVHIKNDATGDWQDPTVDYTVSGTTLSFTTPPATGIQNIVAIEIAPNASIIVPADGSVTQIKLAPDVLLGAAPNSVGQDELKHGVAGEIQSWNGGGAPETIAADGQIGSVLTWNGSGTKPSWQLQGEAAAGTVLLIHSDTFDGDTVFTDSSASGHTITTAGTPEHKTGHAKFGATAIKLDDNVDELRIAPHDDFDFGTGDFVVETWFEFVYLGTDASQSIFRMGSGINLMSININSFEGDHLIRLFAPGGIKQTNFAAGVLLHVAMIRSGNTMRAFLNGVQFDTDLDATGDSIHHSGQDVKIRYVHSHNLYIDEFSIVKGSDKGWFEGFIPPTSPYNESMPEGWQLLTEGVDWSATADTVTRLKAGTADMKAYYQSVLSDDDADIQTNTIPSFEGDVGVGTTTPAKTFEVAGTAGYTQASDMGTSASDFVSKDYADTTFGQIFSPVSSTDTAITVWDGVTGKLVQDSLVTINVDGGLLSPDDIRCGNTSKFICGSGSFARNGIIGTHSGGLYLRATAGRIYFEVDDGSIVNFTADGRFQVPKTLELALQFVDYAVAGQIDWSMDTVMNARITLTENTGLESFDPVDGQTYKMRVEQDATGGWTLDWQTAFGVGNIVFVTGANLATAASAHTHYECDYNASKDTLYVRFMFST